MTMEILTGLEAAQESDLRVANALVHMYAKSGSVEPYGPKTIVGSFHNEYCAKTWVSLNHQLQALMKMSRSR